MAAVSSVTVVLLLTVAFVLVASEPPPQPPGCATELVAFSPCLSYVSLPPNNVTETATPECCDVVSSAFESGDDDCLCYFLRQPLIFGFPLNGSKVISLSSVCKTNGSLESVCSGSLALPPFRGTRGSQTSKPYDGPASAPSPSISLPPEAASPPTTISFPPEHAARSPPATPSSSAQLARGFFPTIQVFNISSWFLPGILTLLVFRHL